MATRKITPLAERFARYVDKPTDPAACWLWTGPHKQGGYGYIQKGRRGQGMILAHRLAWELVHGPIPRALCVLHACDEPRCVRVDHLFLGTKADNTHDMMLKGRCGTIGERQPNAVLNEEQVRAILSSPQVARIEAARYGVAPSLIRLIRQRRRWQHIT